MNKVSFFRRALSKRVSLFTLMALVMSIVMPQAVLGQNALREGESKIEFTTKKTAGAQLFGKIETEGDPIVEGARLTKVGPASILTLTQSSVTVKGELLHFAFPSSEITDVIFTNCTKLKTVNLSSNQISSINFTGAPNVSMIYLDANKLEGASMTNFISSLPDHSTAESKGKLVILNTAPTSGEKNKCTAEQVNAAKAKGWVVYKTNIQGVESEYLGEGGVPKHKVTIVPATEGGRFYIKGTNNVLTEFEMEQGTVCEVGVGEEQGWELATLTYNGEDIKNTKKFTVTGPGTLTGSFKKLRFPVTLVSNDYGTISIQGYDSEALKSVEYGSTLVVVPQGKDETCELTSLKVKGKEILPELSFVVRSATTVEAIFTQGGSTTPEGEEIVLTTSRKAGEKIVLWIASGDVPVIEGATGTFAQGKDVEYTLTSSTVKIKGVVRAFRCKNSNVTALDVTKAKSLRLLFAQENALSKLDVSKNALLEDLSCSLNQLAVLNLANNPNLKTLYCYNNNIQSLDLTANANLEQVFCYTNEMNTLKLGEHPNLQNLICFDNNLAEIKIDKLNSLNWFWCFMNQFKGASMDVLMNDLPNSNAEGKELIIVNFQFGQEAESNICTEDHVKTAKSKGWTVYDYNGDYSQKKEFQGVKSIENTLSSAVSVRYSSTHQIIVVEGAQANVPVVVNTLEGVRVVATSTDHAGNAVLDAASLAKGVYLLSAGNATFKVLVP